MGPHRHRTLHIQQSKFRLAERFDEIFQKAETICVEGFFVVDFKKYVVLFHFCSDLTPFQQQQTDC